MSASTNILQSEDVGCLLPLYPHLVYTDLIKIVITALHIRIT